MRPEGFVDNWEPANAWQSHHVKKAHDDIKGI